MARIRTIKPEFWTHEDLSALPEATHMLAAALLNHADDEGYFNANPGLVKAACCPLRDPSVSVQDSLNLLLSAGYIRLGTAADGKRYGHVITFDDHQVVNRPTRSKIKPLSIVWESSSTTHAQISEGSSPERNREQGKEQGREGNEQQPPKPPASGGMPGKGSKKIRSKVTFRAFADACRDAGERMVPADDPVFAYADDMQIPVEFVQLAWRAFAHKHRESNRTQKDWRAHFRDAVRGNWANVWFCRPDGTCELTTVGVQLKRERDVEAQRRAAAGNDNEGNQEHAA